MSDVSKLLGSRPSVGEGRRIPGGKSGMAQSPKPKPKPKPAKVATKKAPVSVAGFRCSGCGNVFDEVEILSMAASIMAYRRSACLSPERRSEIARKAGLAKGKQMRGAETETKE